MSTFVELAIVSDIHYPGPLERARGHEYEFEGIRNPRAKLLLRLFRKYIWLHRPLDRWPLLEQFIECAKNADYLVSNGDYSCDSGFVGLVDEPSFQSSKTCLDRLRATFPGRCSFTFGDHELGKLSMMGAKGGMRLASFHRGVGELGLKPFWRVDFGPYRLLGVTSSLLALPVFLKDTLPEERSAWEELRAGHLEEIRKGFASIEPGGRILLFCHDPSALPFLLDEPMVQSRIPQIEQTIIGHLHTNLVFWKSRLLAGMPILRFGPSVLRMTTALNQAKKWKPFKVRLCPSLAGTELLKDGGYYRVRLDLSGRTSPRFTKGVLGKP